MPSKLNQYNVKKEHLHFFYRFVILPWELEWKHQKFHASEGGLKNFCQTNDIYIKSFASTAKLNDAILKDFDIDSKSHAGVFWFVRTDTKPKDILRHLRNCFAHGKYRKVQKNKVICLFIENVDREEVKAKGFLPVGKLDALVRAACSCEI